ncbi:hypothetical protein NE237_019902 [Protea cynaroides]|uniref:Uncharacterized protein n=1 Tax=Protea cynaroides TaxID=273540 RepID=A0A9Q0H513_9MAGN|nr:hypothetical protein NE237_019902 [Protea cynaroides]
MSQFQTLKSNICSIQAARDEAVQAYESQVTKVTSIAEELHAVKEQATADKQKATEVEKREADVEKRAHHLDKKSAEAEKRAADLGAKVWVLEQNLQEVEASVREKINISIEEFKTYEDLKNFISESEAFNDFRHDLAVPTFWKGIHLLCNYVRRTAGDDFDFSKFEYDVDAPSDFKEVGDTPDHQIEVVIDCTWVSRIRRRLLSSLRRSLLLTKPLLKQLLLRSWESWLVPFRMNNKRNSP